MCISKREATLFTQSVSARGGKRVKRIEHSHERRSARKPGFLFMNAGHGEAVSKASHFQIGAAGSKYSSLCVYHSSPTLQYAMTPLMLMDQEQNAP